MHALLRFQFGLLVLWDTAFGLDGLNLLHVVSNFDVLVDIAFELFLVFLHI